MSDTSIRPAYSSWPRYNQRLRDTVATLSDDQLAVAPSPDRWPLWATIGHLGCQRVFWLCDFAGAPGAETTPFTEAASNCPGDDDLEHVLDATALADALDSTFLIVEQCLDNWTIEALAEVISHPEWDEIWTHTRGFALERVLSHDIYHCAEINEALNAANLPLIDLW